MKYKVALKHGWYTTWFIFDDSMTGQADHRALNFMNLAAETYADVEDEGKGFKCWLEVEADTPEEEDDGDISSED